MTLDIELSALCIICILLGLCIGLFIPRKAYRHSRRFEAPAPIDLGYDFHNPINQRTQVKVGEVDENGFVRMS